MSKRVAFSINGGPAVVNGVPKAKGRPRAIPGIDTRGEPYVRMVTPQDTRAAENAIRNAFRNAHPQHRPWTGAVQINFTAVFETPKSFSRALKDAAARGELFCTRKPDKDNIEKLIVDALNGIAWIDDAQVQGGGVKRYGSPARIDVSIKLLDSPDVPPTPGQRRAERHIQADLPLTAATAPAAKPTKSELKTGLKVAPDLSGWGPHQRKLIEAAMAREEATRRERGK